MAIYQIIRQSAFEPEDIARLSSAYEDVLRQLHLTDRTDPVTETVARAVIDVAQRGLKDPKLICAAVIEQLGIRRTA
jgi:hypothetical protein